jgi:hypothetical protein
MAGELKRKGRHQTARLSPRWQMFADGELDWDDLDDEEVMRGQLRSSAGDFRGRPPAAIPARFVKELQEQQRKRFNDKIPDMVRQAMDTMSEVMGRKNPVPGDGARVAAAKYIIDRYAGKTPENVNLQAHVTSKFEENLSTVMVYDEEQEED